MQVKNQYHFLYFNFYLTTAKKITQRVRVKKAGVKTYFNAQHILYELSSEERVFLDYLIEEGKLDNRLFVDLDVKKNFCDFLKNKLHLKSIPTIDQLNRYLKKFINLGLALKEDGQKGYYRINPKYFWKGTEGKRKITLQKLVESRVKSGLPFACLIDRTEDEFLKPMI